MMDEEELEEDVIQVEHHDIDVTNINITHN